MEKYYVVIDDSNLVIGYEAEFNPAFPNIPLNERFDGFYISHFVALLPKDELPEVGMLFENGQFVNPPIPEPEPEPDLEEETETQEETQE